MLIVVSSAEMLENEPAAINQLFAAGLKLFHLRKPDAGEEEIRNLLTAISEEYLPRVVLHQHHLLAGEFGIHRIHFKEAERRKLTASDYSIMEDSGLVYSTSVHSPEAYQSLNQVFRYAFFGPVFESISKPGYTPEKEMKAEFGKYRSTKVIGIGGITEANAASVLENGFDGVAVCGTIWQSGNKVEAFEKILMNLGIVN
ncbi:thiamine-phosphate pyrophosphorylase [Algoriphagus sp. 4150]|uniref:thiamine phosphate synthase n=1 Tax=Algoriphagus sp. 4150 TaxID=2817756 RepID=UPI002861D68B|nr:thiamine phosphate synthase [Algoriphagus sp. 4150]MDR7128975.1 thiamine-phosphate pyrophosphorylase [Algoriphagus sp. 4150]